VYRRMWFWIKHAGRSCRNEPRSVGVDPINMTPELPCYGDVYKPGIELSSRPRAPRQAPAAIFRKPPPIPPLDSPFSFPPSSFLPRLFPRPNDDRGNGGANGRHRKETKNARESQNSRAFQLSKYRLGEPGDATRLRRCREPSGCSGHSGQQPHEI
jgi:hypothetical protein